jgi:hypothetical protein
MVNWRSNKRTAAMICAVKHQQHAAAARRTGEERQNFLSERIGHQYFCLVEPAKKFDLDQIKFERFLHRQQ